MRNEVGDKVVGEENLAVFCSSLSDYCRILQTPAGNCPNTARILPQAQTTCRI